ncbi:PDZ domain-containing protein [uncultured Deinococcus sp.]|uniref:PDZ domain-containing protein n=1 Tax=uncultured Deinococcus sp. TaxID=158789 RepID=UPI0025ECCD43|nr:PDZ domain-containing protein [uncultured Deinococcus sp.]
MSVGLVVVLGLGVALAAVTPPTATGQLTGTIVDWPKGSTGTLRLVNAQYPDLADAPIDGAGHFSIQLPSPTVFSEKLPTTAALFAETSNYAAPEFSCKGQGKATPNTGHFQFFGLLATVGDQPPQRLQLNTDPRSPRPVGTVFSDLLYLDVPTLLDGTITCVDGSDTYRGTFLAGWSLPNFTVTAGTTATLANRTVTPEPLPVALEWRLRDQFVGIGIRLDPAPAGAAGFTITAVTPGQPAGVAGVQVGDRLVEIDGKDVTTLSLSAVTILIRGGASGAEAGTTVTLGIQRGTDAAIRQFTITRVLLK